MYVRVRLFLENLDSRRGEFINFGILLCAKDVRASLQMTLYYFLDCPKGDPAFIGRKMQH